MENKHPSLLNLIQSGMLSNEDLIRLLKKDTYKAYSEKLIMKIDWKEVSKDPKLTKKAQYYYFRERDTEVFLETLLSQNFSFEEIENYVAEPNFKTHRETLFNFLKAGFSFKRLLEYAMKVNNPATWEELAKTKEMQALSKDALLDIVKKTKKSTKKEIFYGWAGVITIGKLELSEMLVAAADRCYSDVVKAIAERIKSIDASENEFMDFYNQLSVIQKAARFSDPILPVLVSIITTNVLSEKVLFDIAILSDTDTVWDVALVVSKKTDEELLLFAMTIKNRYVWKALISSKRLSLETALNIAVSENGSGCWNAVLEKYELTAEQYLFVLNSGNADRGIVIRHIPWNEIPFNDCIQACKAGAYAKESYVDAILGQKELIFDEALKLVELVNVDWAWEELYKKYCLVPSS